jgi:hypothetical protein
VSFCDTAQQEATLEDFAILFKFVPQFIAETNVSDQIRIYESGVLGVNVTTGHKIIIDKK